MDGMVLLFGSAPPHTSSSSSRLVLSSPRPAAAAQPLETDSRGHSSSLIREPYSGSHSLLSTLYSLHINHSAHPLRYGTVFKVQASSHGISGTAHTRTYQQHLSAQRPRRSCLRPHRGQSNKFNPSLISHVRL